jgi:hypothetical protein
VFRWTAREIQALVAAVNASSRSPANLGVAKWGR